MKKNVLIGVSICAVVLLVLGSLNNVVGYQVVQSSNQEIIKEKINQLKFKFQNIINIAQNIEIQKIIKKIEQTSDIPCDCEKDNSIPPWFTKLILFYCKILRFRQNLWASLYEIIPLPIFKEWSDKLGSKAWLIGCP